MPNVPKRELPSHIYEVVIHIGTRHYKLLTLGCGLTETDRIEDARASAYKWANKPVEDLQIEEPTLWA